MVGNQDIQGLRPGEKKKTAIALQFITDPDVLFLDEPTSGLDSFTANKIVNLLVEQSRKGKTIIATIHQPNSSTYALFDRLYLLMDGNAIYQGYAKDAAKYFEKLKFKIPTFSNPADYFLKEFFIPYNKTEKDEKKLKTLVDGYDKNLKKIIEKEDSSAKFEKVDSRILREKAFTPNFWTELSLVTIRTGKNLYRNPASLNIRIAQLIIMGLLLNLIFWDLGYSEKSKDSKVGFVFLLSTTQTMLAMQSVLLLFIQERPIFLREYADKTYGIYSYYISKSILETPFQLIFPVILTLIIYFGTGFTPDFGRLCIFALVLATLILCATSIGIFLGCILTDPGQAAEVSMMIMNPFIIFGGYMINLDDAGVWIRWLQYLSPIRYGTEALVYNEFEDNGRFTNGEQVMDDYRYNVGLYESLIILFGIAIFLRISALIFLKLTVKKVQ